MRAVLDAYRSALTGQNDSLRRAVLRRGARTLTLRAGLSLEMLRESRLGLGDDGEIPPDLAGAIDRWANAIPADRLELAHGIGHLLDRLMALEGSLGRNEQGGTQRKKLGSFYTPRAVARRVIASSLPLALSLGRSEFRICDPAAGGGAFLLEAMNALTAHRQLPGRAAEIGRVSLYGIDLSKDAISVLEVALFLLISRGEPPQFFGENLRIGNALTGRAFGAERDGLASLSDGIDFRAAFPGIDGFDWVVGNPPWVAYQGRAARPLPVDVRKFYRARFNSFRGYPTLHAMFVERAAELAPRGLVTLLLPSSVSDLVGYESARAALTKTHEPSLPFEEFGQDAFEGVVQPCFALLATPRGEAVPGDSAAWALSERSRTGERAEVVEVPKVLLRLLGRPKFPKEIFREVGFQTNRRVSETKLLRAAEARAPFLLPLLEGKNVREFQVASPRLFLDAEPRFLEEVRVSLRTPEAYRDVAFVVRQTAAYPIAALHTGHAFRNSLLGGYDNPEFPAALMVALLNSALFRAVHLSRQRDARQAAFPQVKVAHLRGLPAPPEDRTRRIALIELSEKATLEGHLDPAERCRLDQLVFELYECSPKEGEEIIDFLKGRAPGALRFQSSPR